MLKIGTGNLELDDPWGSILSPVMLAPLSTVHTTHNATPMQLVFRKDTMLNVTHLANWQYIQQCRQTLIKKNNKQENAKQKLLKYHVNNRIMIKNNQRLKNRTNVYSRPNWITKVNSSSIVCVQSGKVTDTYNIWNIMLYRK
eukprot:6068175-Ditylum_brightwellii.AAC.1